MSESQKTFLVTGGAGFIGSCLVRHLAFHTNHRIINVDKLTYAGSEMNLPGVRDTGRYVLEQTDITQGAELLRIFETHKPDAVIHLAAESHVDRSISGPRPFIDTNIVGTFELLEASRAYWSKLAEGQKSRFRFLHVSTDEVFGTLGDTGEFSETTPYAPNSPYSASKASSDHLVRAWAETFGLPTLMTNCSNNYGPYQFPEKLIPVMIAKALAHEPLPVYGKGINVRDWLYVEDHIDAILTVLEKGNVGETYNVGCRNDRTNLDVVHAICDLMDAHSPNLLPPSKSHRDLLSFVTDRPGHDLRYAINPDKIRNELGWMHKVGFEEGLKRTVLWYLENQDWVANVLQEAKAKVDSRSQVR